MATRKKSTTNEPKKKVDLPPKGPRNADPLTRRRRGRTRLRRASGPALGGAAAGLAIGAVGGPVGAVIGGSSAGPSPAGWPARASAS